MQYSHSDEAARLEQLRQQAYEKLNGKPTAAGPGPADQLLHELQVHQVELEMQNQELREAQLALETARRTYTRLYDFAPVAYFTLDQRGIIRQCNLAAARLLGHDRGWVSGHGLLGFIRKSDRPDFFAFFGQVLAGQAPAPLRVAVFGCEGQARYLRLEGERLESEAGQVQCLLVAVDVTGQLAAENALRAEAGLLREVEEVARTGHYEADLSTLTFRFSDGLFRLFGQAPQSFRPTLAFIDASSHPDDVPVVRAILDRAAADKKPYHYTRRIYRPDGQLRVLEAHGKVITGADGQAVKLIGLVQDITERSQAEETVRQMLNGSIAAIVLLESVRDANGQIIDFVCRGVNPAAERLTGLSAPQMLQGRFPAWSPGARDDFFDACAQVVETGKMARLEQHQPGAGTWFDVTAVRNGDGLILTFLDITGQQKAGQEIIRLKEEAAQRATDIYHRLCNAIDEGFCIVELLYDAAGRAYDFRYVDVNPAFEKQAGLKVEPGRTIREYLPNVDPALIETYARIIRSGEPARFTFRAPSTGKWYDLYAARFGNPQNHQLTILFTDITGRKEAESQLREFNTQLENQVAERTRQLRESRDLLGSVFDSSPNSITVLEILPAEAGRAEDFRILMLNADTERTTGCSRQELVGKRYAEAFPGVTATGILRQLQRVARTGEAADFEQWYEGEGMQHWFRLIVQRVDHLLVVTTEDVTGRKRAEAEIAKTLALLRQAEQVAGMGSWEHDFRTGAFTWSEGMYRLFGLPLGTPVRPEIYLDYVLDADRPVAEKLIHHLRHRPQPLAETFRIGVNGQVVTLKIKAVVLPEAPGQPTRMLGVDMDMSELRRLEDENLKIRLEGQQQLLNAILEAQEEERRRISESLHNGVGQILYATKLSLAGVHPDALPDDPERAAGALQKVEALLTEAIVETRRVSHELVPTLLKDFGLGRAVTDFCGRFADTGLALDCHCLEDRLPQPLETAIYRMCQELINNIVKHAGATRALLEVTKDKEAVYVEARDNGKGLDPGRLAGHQPGQGIGMRTLRDRVALLGGTLAIDTAPGKGTLITLSIPLG